MSKKAKKLDTYNSIWDNYVSEIFPNIQSSTPYSQKKLEPWRVLNSEDDHYQWPGDEWGSRLSAQQLISEALFNHLTSEARYLCELGAGAGRYTSLTFEEIEDIKVFSFDVSKEFESALRNRLSSFVDSGHLQTFLLDKNPNFMLETFERLNLIGKIDAVYSYDAMVHVDLHTLVVYWSSAAKILKPGGLLSMNIADSCNEHGMMKLFNDAPGVYSKQGAAGGHFMWLSKQIVQEVLQKLGFEVYFYPGNGRDLSFCAKLLETR